MKIREGVAYHITDEYFELTRGCNIKHKTHNGHTYPAYCCCADKATSLFWMIPMSTNIKKYQAVYDREMEKYGHSLSIVFGKFDMKTIAFQIQGMFPLKKEHILHPHTRNGRVIRVEYTLREEIQSKFDKVQEYENKGIKCILTDIKRIEQLLQRP